MPYFDKDAIRECLQMGGNYDVVILKDQIEKMRRDDDYSAQYEVLRILGIMDAEYAREVGLNLDDY